MNICMRLSLSDSSSSDYLFLYYQGSLHGTIWRIMHDNWYWLRRCCYCFFIFRANSAVFSFNNLSIWLFQRMFSLRTMPRYLVVFSGFQTGKFWYIGFMFSRLSCFVFFMLKTVILCAVFLGDVYSSEFKDRSLFTSCDFDIIALSIACLFP